jgi:hypothetical protein
MLQREYPELTSETYGVASRRNADTGFPCLEVVANPRSKGPGALPHEPESLRQRCFTPRTYAGRAAKGTRQLCNSQEPLGRAHQPQPLAMLLFKGVFDRGDLA